MVRRSPTTVSEGYGVAKVKLAVPPPVEDHVALAAVPVDWLDRATLTTPPVTDVTVALVRL